jgi:DNA processing protein
VHLSSAPAPLDWTHCNRDDAAAWLRISLVPGVSPGALRKLLTVLGSPQQVLATAERGIAAIAGEPAARALATGANPEAVAAGLRWLEADGHHLVALHDPRYPPRLLEIADPPPVIYAAGRPELLSAPSLAIVGSRNATARGRIDAEIFARTLSEAGLAIVSGLALGIDAAAHRGGLAGSSSSIAVLGNGADIRYPRDNRALAEALERGGCVISEFPLGTPPAEDNFPRRNRLISGLARGVLVVEAAPRSGSLITARYALEQGREIFAIPGSIHSPVSRGCHKLIKEGAKLVEGAEDVLTELGWKPAAAPPCRKAERDPLLLAMGHGPVSLDDLAEATGIEVARLSARITHLELAGRIATLAGGRFQRLDGNESVTPGRDDAKRVIE